MATCQLSYLVKLKIALDAAKAVNFLHQNKILHRDLKPDNLLVVSLSPDPATVSVKLADFGTARCVILVVTFPRYIYRCVLLVD